MIDLFLAEGFEEVEAIAPVDILRRAGLRVQTVGIGGPRVKGSHGVEVTADLGEKDFSLDGLDMVVLPGGGLGTKNLEKSPLVRAALLYCAQNGRRIAAICAAPSILGHLGLLEGRTAACYPGYEGELGAAAVSKEPVCVSGPFITARGAGVAVDFALRIVEVLLGPEQSRQVRKKIQCP